MHCSVRQQLSGLVGLSATAWKGEVNVRGVLALPIEYEYQAVGSIGVVSTSYLQRPPIAIPCLWAWKLSINPALGQRSIAYRSMRVCQCARGRSGAIQGGHWQGALGYIYLRLNATQPAKPYAAFVAFTAARRIPISSQQKVL